MKRHGFLSILDLLHEGFELCFSADWDLISLVDVINVLDFEFSVLALDMIK